MKLVVNSVSPSLVCMVVASVALCVRSCDASWAQPWHRHDFFQTPHDHWQCARLGALVASLRLQAGKRTGLSHELSVVGVAEAMLRLVAIQNTTDSSNSCVPFIKRRLLTVHIA